MQFFLMFLTSKLSSSFIDGSILGMKSQSNIYLITKWKCAYVLSFGPWRWSTLSKDFMDKRLLRLQELRYA